MADVRRSKKELLAELSDLRRRSSDERRRLDELVQTVHALQENRAELLRLNEALEQKVRARTEELNRRNKELRTRTRKTIEALENERKALSKELHDSISGTLAAVRHRLGQRIEKSGPPPAHVEISLERLDDYLFGMIQETRRISKRLRPRLLEDLGLNAALHELINEFKELYSEMTIFQDLNLAEQSVDDEVKTVLYRIAQEALNNVGKHSGARTISLRLYQQADWVSLEVKDDGCGFDMMSCLQDSETLRYGIRGMRERVEICHGRIDIRSEPGKGTWIKAEIPLG